MDSSMNNRVVLVTGGSSGIGKATAIRFAKAGCKVVITGRKEAALEEAANLCREAGGEALPIRGDMTVEADVIKTIDETIRRFGNLNVLVNNAGTEGFGGIDNTSLDTYDKCFNTNVRAVFHVTMLAIPHLEATKDTIVNVSSFLSTRPISGGIAYCMSKAAIDHFTRCAALDLAPKQIRVNSVNPGYIATNFFADKFDKATLDTFNERASAMHPLGRIGQADEVANAIYFLASDTSSFTTGDNLLVDGGRACVSPF